MGVDPGPFTLRELCLMHDGRSRAMWSHTSSVMALVAEVNRDPKKRSDPYRAGEFDPHARKASAAVPMPKVSIKSLKSTLMGLAPGNGKG